MRSVNLRNLPWASLPYFESAARLGSFNAAAAALHVSNSTVSYHIQLLEEFLGKPLFVRRVRRVTLTDEGQRLSVVLGSALPAIGAVTRAIQGQSASHCLTLQVGPYFSAQWLIPRLAQFRATHPDIELQLQHAITGREAKEQSFDLAISWGLGQWRDFEAERILPVECVPVCSVAYRARREDLETLVATGSPEIAYLNYEGHDAWSEWRSGLGVPKPAALPGTQFDDPNVLNEAAVGGQGVAIGIWPLVKRDLETTRLVLAHPQRVRSQSAYFLLRKKGTASTAAASAFSHWISAQLQAEDAREH
jgi:LysR family transcriptional regulator, glycine cleavage system transcriptional activator